MDVWTAGNRQRRLQQKIDMDFRDEATGVIVDEADGPEFQRYSYISIRVDTDYMFIKARSFYLSCPQAHRQPFIEKLTVFAVLRFLYNKNWREYLFLAVSRFSHVPE